MILTLIKRSVYHSSSAVRRSILLSEQLRVFLRTTASVNRHGCRCLSSTTQQQQQRQQQQQKQTLLSVSSLGMAAVGSCLAFQVLDSHSRSNTTTLAEAPARRPPVQEASASASDKGNTNDSTNSTTENENSTGSGKMDEEDDEEKKRAPWYKRYPTQVLLRMSPSLPGLTSLSGAISDASKMHFPLSSTDTDQDSTTTSNENNSNSTVDNETMFQGQCLERQLHKPAVPYPAWDYNWDGREQSHWSTFEDLSTQQGLQNVGSTGTTRHILLIRHGQYNEGPIDDRKRTLTALGRRQAQLTGQRLAELVHSVGGPQHVTSITTSDLLRAKQTAFIIAQKLPDSIKISQPDPDLNEGLPAPMIPSRPDIPGAIEEIDDQKERMDRAFRKYIHRADLPDKLQRVLDDLHEARAKWYQQKQDLLEARQPEIAISSSGTILSTGMQQPSPETMRQMRAAEDDSYSSSSTNPCPTLPPLDGLSLPPPDHEFDILVCHGNVIRYFLCRALQIPPEAWLRLSVFNCSISYIMIKPNGYVSCRMIGDIGHLGYKETTFSGAHGFMWS